MFGRVVLDAEDSFRQTGFIGLKGALSRYIIIAGSPGCNCFLALLLDINVEVINHYV